MMTFNDIYETAIVRVGGEAALRDRLPIPRTEQELKQLTAAFCLSNMTRRIFQAGLNRKIIDDKWHTFEAVFHQFDIDVVSTMSDEALEKLMDDRRIVRHWRKIQSVRHNAQAIQVLNEEQGDFVHYLAAWPCDNIIAFWQILARRFKQLGGASGAYFLRRVKKDTFLLTTDVIKAMLHWGAIDAIPQNQKQKRQVQDCMNEWQTQSGLPYCQISMILALSVD